MSTLALDRASLIVSTPYTRKAYDNGVKAAFEGKDEGIACANWQARNQFNDQFDGDAVDAWEAGFSDFMGDAANAAREEHDSADAYTEGTVTYTPSGKHADRLMREHFSHDNIDTESLTFYCYTCNVGVRWIG